MLGIPGHLLQQIPGLGAPAPSGPAQIPGVPAGFAQRLPVQQPQLTQLPPFLPSVQMPQNSGAQMPMMRDRLMQAVLAPLMMPNYGVPAPGAQQSGAQFPVSLGKGGMVGAIGSGGLGSGQAVRDATTNLVGSLMARIPRAPSRSQSA